MWGISGVWRIAGSRDGKAVLNSTAPEGAMMEASYEERGIATSSVIAFGSVVVGSSDEGRGYGV